MPSLIGNKFLVLLPVASSVLTMYRGRMKGNKTETNPTDPTLQEDVSLNLQTSLSMIPYLSPVKFEMLQFPSVDP